MKENAKFRRDARRRRAQRVRRKVSGTAQRPRLSVYRSNRHIFAQLVDDESGRTLVAASDLKLEADKDGGKVTAAKAVGNELARKAKEAGLESVVFDRSGYLYHGRVAALAEGAREGGLQF